MPPASWSKVTLDIFMATLAPWFMLCICTGAGWYACWLLVSMLKRTSTRSLSSPDISLPSKTLREGSFMMAVARYSCLRATGLLWRVNSKRFMRGDSLSRSAMSATRLVPRCSAWRRGSGTKLESDLRPFSSIRSSRRLMSDTMAPKSTWRTLFLSSTSSRRATILSRPSTFWMSLPCRKSTLRLTRLRCLQAASEWMSLKPIWRTSSAVRVIKPTVWGGSVWPRGRSGTSASTLLWLRRRTARAVRPERPARSEIMLLSRLRTRRLGKCAPLMQPAVSRIFWDERSSSDTCSKNLCPTFSTRKSSVSLPL
mmetsp:Transcript_16256/g.40973  ORF Transcript_16256/g.40973 Transcript_16256/m.40973 type:complete len:311 (-) Transcript_16256:1569-2501(-)